MELAIPWYAGGAALSHATFSGCMLFVAGGATGGVDPHGAVPYRSMAARKAV